MDVGGRVWILGTRSRKPSHGTSPDLVSISSCPGHVSTSKWTSLCCISSTNTKLNRTWARAQTFELPWTRPCADANPNPDSTWESNSNSTERQTPTRIRARTRTLTLTRIQTLTRTIRRTANYMHAHRQCHGQRPRLRTPPVPTPHCATRVSQKLTPLTRTHADPDSELGLSAHCSCALDRLHQQEQERHDACVLACARDVLGTLDEVTEHSVDMWSTRTTPVGYQRTSF